MASHGWFPRRSDPRYEGIDLKRVWQIVRHDLPVVREAVEKLLPPLEELEKELAEPETDKEKSKNDRSIGKLAQVAI